MAALNRRNPPLTLGSGPSNGGLNPPFRFMDLPLELRLMIYTYVVANGPLPLIRRNGQISHPLLHPRLRRIRHEVCDAVFHTVPLELPHPGALISVPRVLYQSTTAPFIRLHDQHCGPNNRRRIRFNIWYAGRLECSGYHMPPCQAELIYWRGAALRKSLESFFKDIGIPHQIPWHSITSHHRMVFLAAHALHIRDDWVGFLVRVLELCFAVLLCAFRTKSLRPKLTLHRLTLTATGVRLDHTALSLTRRGCPDGRWPTHLTEMIQSYPSLCLAALLLSIREIGYWLIMDPLDRLVELLELMIY